MNTPSSVGLFRELCRNPPLLPAPGGLSDFEFVVLATSVMLAWRQHSGRAHDAALAAGRAAIDRKRTALAARGEPFDPEFDRFTVDERVRWAGSGGYSTARSKALRDVPAEVEVRITSSGLLAAAGLSRSGSNLRRLPDALDRLLDPVTVIGRKGRAPLLLDWWTLRSGRLKLIVNARGWLPRRRFARVLLPLPTNTRTRVLPLYLLLHVLDFSKPGRIAFDDLCEALGIPLTRWPADAARALRRAVTTVNDHLAHRVNREDLQDRGMPTAIAVEFLDDGGVRFVDVARRQHQADQHREAILDDALDEASDVDDFDRREVERRARAEQFTADLRRKLEA